MQFNSRLWGTQKVKILKRGTNFLYALCVFILITGPQPLTPQKIKQEEEQSEIADPRQDLFCVVFV